MRSSLRLACVLLATALWCQDRTGSITGTVTDAAGGGVGEALVTAVQAGTGETRTVRTSREGIYRLMGLAVGQYAVSVEREGFKTSRHDRVRLEVDRTAVVDFQLELGERLERIVVTGQARLIEATPSALSSLVDAPAIERLPLNGRDYIQLAVLQAGAPVARAQDRNINLGFGLQISISGSRPFQNAFRLDGLTTTYNGSTPASINGINLGVEAVAEFSVHGSTYSAQYGQAGGGVVNAVTKSGTNEFHGSLFWFHRNDALDARNFFDAGEPPEFRRHQFGGSLGGPLRRNRAFFFASYEGLREARGNTTINTTLSPAARRGELTTGTVRIHPEIERVLAFYPLPTGPVLGDTGLFIFANDTSSRQNFLTSRLDASAGAHGKIFFRGTRDAGTQESQTDFAAGLQRNATRQHSAVLEEMQVLSPRLLNTARAGVVRTWAVTGATTTRIPGTDSPEAAFVPGRGVLGLITVTGLTEFPGGSGAQAMDRTASTSYQASDDLSLTRGRHSISAGVRLERTHYNLDSQTTSAGDFRFRDLSRFLRNLPERFRAQFPGSDTVRALRQWVGAAYLHDTWKAARRWTLDAGLRWESASVPSEAHHKLSNLDLLSSPQMRVGPLFENPSRKNFAPRLGLAWDVFGNGRTLLRGGYGVYPDLVLVPYVIFLAVRNAPFFLRGETRTLAEGAFPRGGYAALMSNPTPEVLANRIPRDLPQPYVQQWNFNVEQSLGRDTALRAAYVGSHGLNLSSITYDANLAQPVKQPDGRLFFPANGKRVNAVFSEIRNRTFDAHSFYEGLQTALRRRLSRGLQAQLTFTWSKSIDDSSNFFSGAEATNRGMLPLNDSPRFNRGLSGHDVRHYFTGSGTWDLPSRGGRLFGRLLSHWRLGAIVTYASGLPDSIYISYDAARTQTHASGAATCQRPDLAPGADRTPVTGNPQRWVDPSAFARPPAGYLGNLGRNTLIGPDLATADVSLVRRFPLRRLGESGGVELRLEAFNVLNRANFDLPEVDRMVVFTETATPEDFARITSAGASREIQVGLKLRF